MDAETLIKALTKGAFSEETLAAVEKEAWKNKDTGIEYNGSKITLPLDPKKMPLEAAIDALERKLEEENQILDVNEHIDAYPLEAAVAFVKAMQRIYGWAQPVPTPGFFGPVNPDMLTVRTGPGTRDTIQVPLGSFKVPGIERPIVTRIHEHKGRPVLCISGQVRTPERHVLMDLVNKAREILQEESIYRGKALKMRVNEDGTLQENFEPEFLATAHIDERELILPRDTEALVRTALFTPIERTEVCLKHKVPLKRGVLLEGPYGTGKSMTAAVTSKLAVDNGWTFVHLDNVSGLKEALAFAKRYEPAVIFAEDIDRAMEERDEDANDLLNTIDGVLSKDSKVIVVLTTNHVEKINRAMLRPGRLDSVISILPPDAESSQRLVRLYARGLLAEDVSLDLLGAELAGQIPATIREVVERAKLAMIQRDDTTLSEEDLVFSARGMKRHLELLNGERDDNKSNATKFGEAFAALVAESTGVTAANDGDNEEVLNSLGNVQQKLSTVRREVNMISATGAKAAEQHTELLAGMTKDTKAIKKAVGAK